MQERIAGFGISFPTSSYVEVGVASALRLGMTAGSDYTCTLTFEKVGSTSDVRNTDMSSTPPNTDYSYTFSSAGDYEVTAICDNDIVGGTASDTLSTRGVERIAGLALDPPGAEVGQPYRIYVTWTSGTDLTLGLTFDGNNIPMEFIDGERKAMSEVRQAETSTGRFPVVVTLSNVIGPEVLNIDFSIEVEITGLTVVCDFLNEIPSSLPAPNVVIPTNSDVNCSVTMQTGTSVTVSIDWGDGSTPYAHAVGIGNSWASNPAPPDMHSFTTPAICSMSVIVENGFGRNLIEYTVNVMTSVDNVILNPVSPKEFTPPTSFTFTWR